MGIVKYCWDYLLIHENEIVWALIFCITFEALQPLSLISRIIREVRNKLAQQSLKQLRSQIASLEKYRNSLNMYLLSDKAHYLTTLRFLLAAVAFMGMGACFVALEFLPPTGRFAVLEDLLALSMFIVGVFIAIYARRIASFDTQEKLSSSLAFLDREIALLKSKLPGS